MKEMKVFVKKNCPNCPKAKELAKEFEGNGTKASYYDVETVDGLTEATMLSVKAAPSILIMDEKGREMKGWRGKVPEKKEIEEAIH